MARLPKSSVIGLVLLATATTTARYQVSLSAQHLSFIKHRILSQVWLYSLIAGLCYLFSSEIRKVRNRCLMFALNGFSIAINLQTAFFKADPSLSVTETLTSYIINATRAACIMMTLRSLVASGDLSLVEDPEVEALEDAGKGGKIASEIEQKEASIIEKHSEKVETHEASS